MTENEAINILQLNRPFAYSELQNAVDMAIQALEEIQAYRLIGTVEECKQRKEYFDIINEVLKDYSDIGTIDEFKALKEKSVAKKANKIERKRDENGVIYQIGECPCCGKLITDDVECCDCMQKLDWSE